MTENPPEVARLTVGTGEAARDIAVRHRPGRDGLPGVVWLGGFRSDMDGTKAVEIDRYCGEAGLACTRFDYSGHGLSGGAFKDGTISRWLEEALAVTDGFTRGPQILVGSSMGAWVALRLVQELRGRGEGGRLAGLLFIAPAPDFTMELMEPDLSEAQKRDLAEKGYFEEPTPYGPVPNVYTKALFDDGRKNRVLRGVIETGCPVHILQGLADPDVPHSHALLLVEHLPADDTVLTLIREGDHRLSRPRDIERILSALDGLVDEASPPSS